MPHEVTTMTTDEYLAFIQQREIERTTPKVKPLAPTPCERGQHLMRITSKLWHTVPGLRYQRLRRDCNRGCGFSDELDGEQETLPTTWSERFQAQHGPVRPHLVRAGGRVVWTAATIFGWCVWLTWSGLVWLTAVVLPVVIQLVVALGYCAVLIVLGLLTAPFARPTRRRRH